MLSNCDILFFYVLVLYLGRRLSSLTGDGFCTTYSKYNTFSLLVVSRKISLYNNNIIIIK